VAFLLWLANTGFRSIRKSKYPILGYSSISFITARMPKSIYSAGQEKLQELLRQIRQDAGLTQAGLATKLGRPQSFVSKYESGERRLDMLELRVVCNALKITLPNFVQKLEAALRGSRR
jgi:ribosome-binding protein aMBF1 (putative translation factor)